MHGCLQRLNTMQISLWHQTRNRPMPLTSSVVWQMMARFCNFYNVKKVETWFKKGQCVSNRCKDLFKQKKYFAVVSTLSYTRFNWHCWNIHLSPFFKDPCNKIAQNTGTWQSSTQGTINTSPVAIQTNKTQITGKETPKTAILVQ